jgi:hypothetical protein
MLNKIKGKLITAQVNRLRRNEYFRASFFKNISPLLAVVIAIIIFFTFDYNSVPDTPFIFWKQPEIVYWGRFAIIFVAILNFLTRLYLDKRTYAIKLHK